MATHTIRYCVAPDVPRNLPGIDRPRAGRPRWETGAGRRVWRWSLYGPGGAGRRPGGRRGLEFSRGGGPREPGQVVQLPLRPGRPAPFALSYANIRFHL